MTCPACRTVFPSNTIHRCTVQAPPPFTPPIAPQAPPPATSRGTVFGPKPTVENARAEVLVKLEDLYALVCKESGMTPEREKAFRQYKLALNRALAKSTSLEDANEAATALCVAALQLVKVTF